MQTGRQPGESSGKELGCRGAQRRGRANALQYGGWHISEPRARVITAAEKQRRPGGGGNYIGNHRNAAVGRG